MQKRLILCNLKELFEAFKEKHPDTKIGFSKFCSLRPKEECMIHRCPNCPTEDSMIDYLNEIFVEYENDQEISYKQWIHTDHSSLNIMRIEDFIGIICNSLQELTKSQAEYLQQRKDNIDNETVISLGNFAENYSFVVQDEVQSFHWNNFQCTLHPVVLYYKIDDLLMHKSFCIMMI